MVARRAGMQVAGGGEQVEWTQFSLTWEADGRQ